MKADSFHTVFSEKQSKYNQFLGQQIFSGYRVRGKDHLKKSQTNHTPSDDKSSISHSQSYIMAMRALQDKVKALESDNSNLQALMLSYDICKDQQKKQEMKFKEPNNAQSGEQNAFREQSHQMAQIDLNMRQMKEEYEEKLSMLQQNMLSITQQADQKYRELLDEIQILYEFILFRTEQLEIQNQNNLNYRTKINQLNQNFLQEKQNQNTMKFMLDQEKNENRLILEKNDKLQQDLCSLKEELFDIQDYMDQYTQQYNPQVYQDLVTENKLQQQNLLELTKQLEEEKESYHILQLNFEQKMNELQKSEVRATSKLSQSNTKIDQLRQQLLSFHSNPSQSPRIVKQYKNTVKPVSQQEMSVKAQKIRDQRQLTDVSMKKLKEKQFLTSSLSQQQQNNYYQSVKQSQEKGNESQSSLLSRLIIKTLEENQATQPRSDDPDEMVQSDPNQQKTMKQQQFLQAAQRIDFLDELLQSLNLKYEDIEAQVIQEKNIKQKKEKRKELLEIIEQMQGVDKELNDLITIQKLASQH